MTKKERKEVYLKAAELIGNIPGNKYWACCPTISYVIYGENRYEKVTSKKFPEFYLLKPKEYMGMHSSWWMNLEKSKELGLKFNHEINVKERQIALLLAAEMCN